MHTDPIADLLTRLRNASLARQQRTSVPNSRTKLEIVRILKDKELIAGFHEKPVEGKVGRTMLDIELIPEKKLSLKRISKPGQRIYKKAHELFPVLHGFGISIISTSQGIMTGEEARKKGSGGELLCEIH